MPFLRGGRSYYTAGRQERLDPSPRCCSGMDCLRSDGRRRHAVVTMLRSDNYLGVAQVAHKCLSLTFCDEAEHMLSVSILAHRISVIQSTLCPPQPSSHSRQKFIEGCVAWRVWAVPSHLRGTPVEPASCPFSP